MSKGTKKLFIFLFLGIALLGIILYLIETEFSNKYMVFYAEITEKTEQSYTISKFSNEKFIRDYEFIYVTLEGDLEVGDIVKIKAHNYIMESYPPQIRVVSYEKIASVGRADAPAEPALSFDNETDLIYKFNSDLNNFHERGFSEEIKQSYYNLIDFILGNKMLGNYQYQNLTDLNKINLINKALEFHNELTTYNEFFTSNYLTSEDRLIALYLDEIINVCSKDKTICNQTKNEFQTVINNYEITWEYLTTIAKYGEGKLADWYLIYNAI